MPSASTPTGSSASAAADAAPQSSASTPIGSSARAAVDATPTLKDDADETCDPDALLSPDRVASSPLPGVVLLKNALDEAGQREALAWALRHGIDCKAWLDAASTVTEAKSATAFPPKALASSSALLVSRA